MAVKQSVIQFNEKTVNQSLIIKFYHSKSIFEFIFIVL